MKPIAIFYHCLFYLDGKFLTNACEIINGQMTAMLKSGLYKACSQFHVGVNGGPESIEMVNQFVLPRTTTEYHGPQCHTENRTILMLEQWVKSHPDWYVCYFHAKGASHPAGHTFSTTWRNCMMRHVVTNWVQCVKDLDAGYDVAGCHYMRPPATPEGQHIMAGNFWWAKSDFLRTLPSIMARDRIKVSGLDSLESRYESEVILGNGPRLPKVKDYHGPHWNPGQIATCSL